MNKRNLLMVCAFLWVAACRTGGDWKKDDTLFVRKESRPTPQATPTRTIPRPTPAAPTAKPTAVPQQSPITAAVRPQPTPVPKAAPTPAVVFAPSASRQELQSRAQALEQRIALNPNPAPADRQALGDAYAAMGRYRLAYDQYRSALAASPNLQGCLSMAKVQALAGDGAGALRLFQDSCAKYPASQASDKGRRQLLEAFLLWRANATNDAAAINILKSRILDEPRDPQAFALLGQIAYGKGQYALAKTYYTKALEVVPGTKPNEILQNLALAHQALGEEDEAKALWRQTLQNDPSFVPALTQMGQAALKAKDAAHAQQIFRQLTQIDPANGDYFLNLGVALRLANQVDQAEIEYLRALKLKPDDAAALFNLGLLYQKNKRDPMRALYFYQKIGAVDPQAYQSKKVKELVQQAQRDANRSMGAGGKK